MILCLDIGNTHIFGGLYAEDSLQLQFRYPSSVPCTSDQLGIFFKTVLQENGHDPQHIKHIGICSVVPSLNYSVRSAFLKYFEINPFFISNDKSGLNINYANPHEIGADRISNAIAAIHHYPGKNIIVVDLGTATTFDAIAADKTYLGGAIIPGLQIAMKSLSENTAKLSAVNITKPQDVIGQSTATSIQAGLYYSHLGAAREIIQRITTSVFQQNTPVIVGTGGFAHLFDDDQLFTAIVPELVLKGIHIAVKQNQPT